MNAETLNPVLPKRLITAAQIYEWPEAPSIGESDLLHPPLLIVGSGIPDGRDCTSAS